MSTEKNQLKSLNKTDVSQRSKLFYCASKLLGEQKCKYQCFDCVGYKA